MPKDLNRPLVVSVQNAFEGVGLSQMEKKRFTDTYVHSCACFAAAHLHGFNDCCGVGKRSNVSSSSSWKPTESVMD